MSVFQMAQNSPKLTLPPSVDGFQDVFVHTSIKKSHVDISVDTHTVADGLSRRPPNIEGVRATWVFPVSSENPDKLINDGVVVFDNVAGNLLFVSSYSEFTQSEYKDVQLQSLGKNRLLIPGLINCHVHSPMSLMRGFSDDQKLHDWLRDIWIAEKAVVSAEYVTAGTELAVYEMLKTGTTTFCDQYFHSNATIDVCMRAGIRVANGEPILVFDQEAIKHNDPAMHALVKATVDDILERRVKYPFPNVIPMMNPHAPYTVPDGLFKHLAHYQKQLNCGMHIHLNESTTEIHNYNSLNKRSAFQTLKDHGLLTEKLVCAHCVVMTEEEIDCFAANRVNVVHCPKSNLKLASGFCPAQYMLDKGVNVCIGSDGCCSNNGLNLLSDMQVAALLGKAVSDDATAMNCKTVIKMATTNGAKALGVDHLLGSLEKGKLCDMVSIDISAIECSPIFDPISTVVYSGGRKVDSVWIGGKKLVEGGRVLNFEVDLNKVDKFGNQLLSLYKLNNKVNS